MKIGLIFGGVVIAVLGGLLLGGVLQVAPTDSVKVHQFTPSSPSNVITFASNVGTPFIASWSGDQELRYSGVSLLVFTAIRDTSVYWTLQFSVRCGQVTMAGGTANVYAYIGNPSATKWSTLSVQGNTSAIKEGQACTVQVSRTGGSSGSGLYWVSEPSGGGKGLAVWGAPPSSPPPPPTPPPGSTPPPAPTEPGDTTPPPPQREEISVRVILGLFLLLIGALVAIVGIFV